MRIWSCRKRHTGKPGPGTLVGPYKNRKTGTLAGPYENRKIGTLEGLYKNRKTGTLAGPYENRKTGILAGSYENRKTGTLADPSGSYINPTYCKNVLHKQHGQLGFHFLMLF